MVFVFLLEARVHATTEAVGELERTGWARPEGWRPMERPPRDPISSAFTSGHDLRIDEHGAPVTFEAARWLVCFVPGLRAQFWHRFVHRTHKHVLLLKPNRDGNWTLFEPWWTRLLVRTITADQALRFLSWAAMGDVLLVEEDIPGHGSQFLGWANCASLAAFVLGRPCGLCSPHTLFKRLLSEDRTQRLNVAEFVEGCLAAQPAHQADELRDIPAPQASPDLREVLADLGWRTETMVSAIPSSNRGV